MSRLIKKEEVETNPIFAEFLQQSRANSPPMPYRRPSKTSR
jgi:hypothetical protein